MKRIISIALGTVIFASVIAFAAVTSLKSNAIGPTMSATEARTAWGFLVFDEQKFKTGSIQERAKMAADLLQTKKMVGVPVSSIRTRLGEFTGYFWNDTIPAYLINEGWKTDKDVWQLVFLPGKDGKVKDVIINKNCCDKTDK